MGNGFPRLLIAFALFLPSLVSHSFKLKGHDLGRVESWLALVYPFGCGLNLRAE